MSPFAYRVATDPSDAIDRGEDALLLGGGTNLVDLMRQNVVKTGELVDVSRLPGTIEATPGGGLRIGASVSNSALAAHRIVRRDYPVLARALLAGASQQIRNMASVGGNVMQRTRCAYFYDTAGARCNKRDPGSGCDALAGFNRYHAVLGASASCIATHPSDMCVALVALDAVLHIEGPQGARRLPLADFHLLPGDTPHFETQLQPGEMIVAVELPASDAAALRSDYRKVRDRSSYAFGLVSVAAGISVVDGKVETVRIALGGVAPRPWRARLAETALFGQPAVHGSFVAAMEDELSAAQPLSGNAFKPALACRTAAALLASLAGDAS